MQSNRPAWSASSASAPVPTAVVCTSPPPISSTMLRCARLVVLDHQQALHRPVDELVQRRERLAQRLLRGRLGQEVEGAEPEAALPVLVHRDDVDRDVAGGRVVLEPVEDGPAVHVGQAEVERDAVGWYSRASASARSPRWATIPLKPRSRARSSRICAKAGSSSTIRRTRSPGSMALRSSPMARSTTGASMTRELAVVAGLAGSTCDASAEPVGLGDGRRVPAASGRSAAGRG